MLVSKTKVEGSNPSFSANQQYSRNCLFSFKFMELKKLKSVTNGTRHQVSIKKSLLSKNNRIYRLTSTGLTKTSGRGSHGKITVWHKGKRHKRIFHFIEFFPKYSKAIIISTFYDSFRSAFVFFNFDFLTNSFFKTLAVNNLYPGSLIETSFLKLDIRVGYRTYLKNIPAGSLICNLHLPNLTSKSQFIRSAGTFGQILQNTNTSTKIKLPSKKIIEVSPNSIATVGTIANFNHKLIVLGKAGRNRHLGVRPTVRGIAMNPVDHPHGGRTNGGKPSVTPWGLPTKGKFSLKKNIYE